MNKIKAIAILVILLLLFTTISALSYVEAVTTDISNNVFRLHVIANSDSEEDQNLKYTVRDEILKYVSTISETAKSKQELIDIIRTNSSNIEKVAKDTVVNNGYNYDISLEIGNFSFPTKTYGDISLPASFYDALKIKIGAAEGKNWWCVMFPPLCFIDITTGIVDNDSKAILEDNLNEEEYALVSQDEGLVKFKFKLLEMFGNMNLTLGNK